MKTTDRHGAAAEHFDYLEFGPEIDGDDDADATGHDAGGGDAPADAQPATATSPPSRAEA